MTTVAELPEDRSGTIIITVRADGPDVSQVELNFIGDSGTIYQSITVWNAGKIIFGAGEGAVEYKIADPLDGKNTIVLTLTDDGTTVAARVNDTDVAPISLPNIASATQVKVSYLSGSGTESTLDLVVSSPIPTWLWVSLGISIFTIIVVGVLSSVAQSKKRK